MSVFLSCVRPNYNKLPIFGAVSRTQVEGATIPMALPQCVLLPPLTPLPVASDAPACRGGLGCAVREVQLTNATGRQA